MKCRISTIKTDDKKIALVTFNEDEGKKKKLDIGKTIMTECAYCEEYKETVIWGETDEYVCYDCRLELLDQEFKE